MDSKPAATRPPVSELESPKLNTAGKRKSVDADVPPPRQRSDATRSTKERISAVVGAPLAQLPTPLHNALLQCCSLLQVRRRRAEEGGC
jgi:hypothetical protein